VSRGVPMQFNDVGDEQPMDVSRYLSAIRRGSWLIVLIVVPLTATVLALSLALPKSYSASTKITVEDTGSVLAPTDNDTATRRLATMRALLTSPDVLDRAARALPGETGDTLKDKVSASVDPVASIITVKANDGDPAGAAQAANSVARTFLVMRRAAEARRFADARQALELALRRAQQSKASPDEIQALRDRLSELDVTALAGGDELQIAQAARPPDSPDSPQPLQNTLIAFVAALFIAVLAALVRDLLAPRVRNARELSALTGLTPLVVLPTRRTRRRPDQVSDAYQALAAALRVQLSDSQRVVLITSPTGNEDRASVTFGLGRALAAGDIPATLVSADLRRAGLHRQLGIEQSPGLSDVLQALEAGDKRRAADLVRRQSDVSADGLRSLPSGEPGEYPTATLSGDSLGVVLDELSNARDGYVLVEGPPLLGPIDGQLVARWTDAVIVVCRLDRLWPGDASELGEVLARIEAPVLGAVVIGGTRARYSLPAWTPRRTAAVAPKE
jgi:succinoglycan biosynthesis transport protein ExoP